MFASIYNAHLRERLRRKRLNSQLDHRFDPYLADAQRIGKYHSQERGVIGITNLFILATAALATSSRTQLHIWIDKINTIVTRLNDSIKDFDADAVLQNLLDLQPEIIQASKDAARGEMVSEGEALIFTFYVKNAMAPTIDETVLELRKVKQKLAWSGQLEPVAKALEDLGKVTVVLGSALLMKTPKGNKDEAFDLSTGIATYIHDAVRYLRR